MLSSLFSTMVKTTSRLQTNQKPRRYPHDNSVKKDSRSLLYCSSFLALLFVSSHPVYALDNDSERTPTIGYGTWNQFHADINEEIIHEQVDLMVKHGFRELGYEYINIDDGWFAGRNCKGHIQYDKKKFPHGMKALADYIHSKRLNDSDPFVDPFVLRPLLFLKLFKKSFSSYCFSFKPYFLSFKKMTPTPFFGCRINVDRA